MSDNRTRQNRIDLNNALASISNVMWTIQHKPPSYDERIKMLDQIRALIPICIRYMIYFKNIGE